MMSQKLFAMTVILAEQYVMDNHSLRFSMPCLYIYILYIFPIIYISYIYIAFIYPIGSMYGMLTLPIACGVY